MPEKQTPSNPKPTEKSPDVKEPSNVRPASRPTPEEAPDTHGAERGASDKIESEGE